VKHVRWNDSDPAKAPPSLSKTSKNETSTLDPLNDSAFGAVARLPKWAEHAIQKR